MSLRCLVRPIAPPPVILTNRKDLPAKLLLESGRFVIEQALRAGILRSGSK
jgi:hypothetical protein